MEVLMLATSPLTPITSLAGADLATLTWAVFQTLWQGPGDINLNVPEFASLAQSGAVPQTANVPEPVSPAVFGIGACVAVGGAVMRRRRDK